MRYLVYILFSFSSFYSYSQCVTITKEYPKSHYSEKTKKISSYANCDTTQFVKWEYYYNDTLFEKRVYDNDSIYLSIIYENELVVDSGKWLIRKGLDNRTGFHYNLYKNKLHTGEYIPLFYFDTMAYFDPISGTSVQQIVTNDGSSVGIHKTYDTNGVLLDSTLYNNEGKPLGIINIRDEKNRIINRLEYDSTGNRLYKLESLIKPVFLKLNEIQYNSLKLKPDTLYSYSAGQENTYNIFSFAKPPYNNYQESKSSSRYIKNQEIKILGEFNYLIIANQKEKINHYSLNTKTGKIDTLINLPIPLNYQKYLSILSNRIQIWEIQNDNLVKVDDFEIDVIIEEAYWMDYKNILVKSTDNKYFKIQVFE